MKRITVHFAMMIAAALPSCEGVLEDVKPVKATFDQYEMDNGFILSQKLSLAIKNEDIRNFIKKKAWNRFDGDYKKEKRELIKSVNGARSITFEQALFNGTSNNLRLESSQNISLNDPLLHIAVPEHPGAQQEWDPINEVPIIVYLPRGVNSAKVTSLPAFDHDGHLIEFNPQEIPDQPVVVVSYNERIVTLDKDSVDAFI